VSSTDEQQGQRRVGDGTPPPMSFEVQLPGPLDIPASLELFRCNGDDLIDRWDGVMLLRTLPVESQSVAYACTVSGTREEPLLRVFLEDATWRLVAEKALMASFVKAPTAWAALLQTDPVLARLEHIYRGLRPVLQHDLLTALIRSISAQQVNLRWATTLRRRLAEVFGEKHFIGGQVVYSLHAGRLAAARPADIRALQFTMRKAEYIIGVAETIASGDLQLARLAELSDEEVILRLTSIRGIGRWTAEWLLVRTLGRPCVVAGDLAVRKAIGQAYLLKRTCPSEQEVREVTVHWEASASIAQTLLLQGLRDGAI